MSNGDTLSDQLSLIPRWAYVVAAAIFIGLPILFLSYVSRGNPADQGLLFRVLFPLVPATFLAFLALMVGYVNQDAGRRGMSRTAWTLIVIFVPNALGFILYFLMRKPKRMVCPKCGALSDARTNFCPSCRHEFHPTCPQCKAAIQGGSRFCANCGTPLQGDGSLATG
jgi:hypothetical protein